MKQNELLDPLRDQKTGYYTGRYFRESQIAHYLKKAETAERPVGIILVEVPEAHPAGSSHPNSAEGIKDVIDSLTVGGQPAFDAKASDNNRYYMIIRIADKETCRTVCAGLRQSLERAGYGGSRVAAKSFSPTRGLSVPLQPSDVLKSLEDALS